MSDAQYFELLKTVRTSVRKALPATVTLKRKRTRQQASASRSAPPTSSIASSPALPASPVPPLPASPASLSPISYDILMATLRNWSTRANQEIIGMAAAVPSNIKPALYCSDANFRAFEESERVTAHYILSIHLQAHDEFSFPLIVVPHIAAHKPWPSVILDEPLFKYRPERFASNPSVLVKHALLVHVVDLLIRPFGFPLGSLTIDPADTNTLVYHMVIPDGFDIGPPELFLQSFLFSTKLKDSSTDPRSSSRKALAHRDPWCPVTFIRPAHNRQVSHMLDDNIGRSLIAQGLHDEAAKTGRYRNLLLPWKDHEWRGTDIDKPVNQILLSTHLNNTFDQWAFSVLQETPHRDDAVCWEMFQILDLWNNPEPQPRPAVIFLNWEPGDEHFLPPFVHARKQNADELDLSGFVAVWSNPDDPLDAYNLPPRPPNWFPAHPSFPPPFLLNNTLASRMIKSFASYIVDGFASCIPEGYGPYVANDLRKRRKSSSTSVHQDGDDSSSKGNDPGRGFGPGGDDGGQDESDVEPHDAPPPSPKLDGNPQHSTLAVLSLAVLALAATYAEVVEKSDICSGERDELDSPLLDDGYPAVDRWLSSLPSSTTADFYDDIEPLPLSAPASRSICVGVEEEAFAARKRPADESVAESTSYKRPREE